jgi:hypothetical protein
VWKRFLNVTSAQLTESFEIERQKGLSADNQKTLAPHQHVETAAAEHKRRQAIRISITLFILLYSGKTKRRAKLSK